MKAGCYFFSRCGTRRGSPLCCNIPKLNEEFESFSGANKARVLKIRQGQDSFCVELPPLAGSASYSVCQGQYRVE